MSPSVIPKVFGKEAKLTLEGKESDTVDGVPSAPSTEVGNDEADASAKALDGDLEPVAPESELPIMKEAREEASCQEDLKKAVCAGDVGRVVELLDARADVHHKYQVGLTALHFAALQGQVEVTRLLVRAGADPLAQTTDEDKISPMAIANAEDNRELFDAMSEDPAPPAPTLWSRIRGPHRILLVCLTNVLVFYAVVDAPESNPEAFYTRMWYQGLTFGLMFACLILLALVVNLDPGAVEKEQVAYIQQLRDSTPEEFLLVTLPTCPAEDESFAVLKEDGSGETRASFRWCRSCRIWKPANVSHCSVCGRCSWRFDHHCFTIGNCVAAGNQRFFVAMLLTGLSAWFMAEVAVAFSMVVHFDSFEEEPWAIVRLPLCFVDLAFACCAWVLMIPFTVFHTGSLLFNYNTKMCLRPKKDRDRHICNTGADFEQLFCGPLRCRPFSWRR